MLSYLRQVNEVNGGDTVFVRCVSVCVSVCLCQQTGQSDQFKMARPKATDFIYDVHVPRDSPHNYDPVKIFRKGAWPGSRDPLNFWASNANSSKMVKATDFKFAEHVSREWDSPDVTP